MKKHVQGAYISQLIHYVLGVLCVFATAISSAEDNLSATLLSPEQAFVFSVESTQRDQARLAWRIQPNYYLYQHKFEVTQGNQALALDLPKAVAQYDENYGHSQVYYQQVHINIATQA